MGINKAALAAALAIRKNRSAPPVPVKPDSDPSPQKIAIAIPIQKKSEGGYVCDNCGHEGESQDDRDQEHETEQEQEHDTDEDVAYAKGGIAQKIMARKKFASGGLEDDQPPYRPAYAEGGEVEDMDDDDDTFLNHDLEVVPAESALDELDNEISPASSDEDEEQTEGKIDLRSILRAVRARHRGR